MFARSRKAWTERAMATCRPWRPRVPGEATGSGRTLIRARVYIERYRSVLSFHIFTGGDTARKIPTANRTEPPYRQRILAVDSVR